MPGIKKENKKDLTFQKMKPDNYKLSKPKKELLISLVMSFMFLSLCIILLAYYYYTNLFPFSAVNVEPLGTYQARVEIRSKIPLKTKVQYGTSDIYFNETEMSPYYTQAKEELVEGLLPNKNHYFRVIAIDEGGKEYTSKFYIL
jgi:hypothetical protein